jgi:hypothetical protein
MVVAWSIGSATAPWSSEPAVRAILGAGMWAAVAVLVAILWKPAGAPTGGTPKSETTR